MIVEWFFFTAVTLEIAYLGAFLLTIFRPSFRFWPPPSARSWQFFTAWLAAVIVAVLFFFVGVLDFDGFVLPFLWRRLPCALAAFTLGSAIGTWASLCFPFRATLGLGDRLITHGPYRFSRNPMYIGDSLLIIGYFLLTNSWRVGIIGGLGVILNLLAPFTEESWLEAHFGDAYRAYKRRVPRFIGRRNRDPA